MRDSFFCLFFGSLAKREKEREKLTHLSRSQTTPLLSPLSQKHPNKKKHRRSSWGSPDCLPGRHRDRLHEAAAAGPHLCSGLGRARPAAAARRRRELRRRRRRRERRSRRRRNNDRKEEDQRQRRPLFFFFRGAGPSQERRRGRGQRRLVVL